MWFSLALFVATSSAIFSALNKKQLASINLHLTLFLNLLVCISVMAIILLATGGFPHVTPKFYLFMTISSVLDIIAFTCGYLAIRHSPISLLTPLNAAVPLFATLFGALFLHEIPTLPKFLGIITIVLGIYLLNISAIKGGFFKPFQKLFSDKGVRLYFVQVLLWGITPIFQKQAIFETSPQTPLFASFFGFGLITLYLFLYCLPKFKREHKSVKPLWWTFFIFGIIQAFSQFAAYTVLATTYVGYATAVFNLSALIGVVFGKVIFKESHLRERLLGAAVMIIGVLLLAL